MVSLRDDNPYAPTAAGRRRGGLGFRISHKQLARMCHSIGSSLHAGVDVRRVWATESQRGSAYHRSKMEQIREQIDGGDTVTEAMRGVGGYFPPLVCEMIEVGERTGRMEQIFLRLSEHYTNLLRLRRAFLMGIAWPTFELSLGLFVIGVFIWLVGAFSGGSKPAITFLGLYGTRGLMIYLSVIGVIIAAFGLVIFSVKNDWLKLDPLYRLVMHIPGLGAGLKTMAISRLSWSMALATDSDIDARRAVELSLRTTQNSYYTDHIEGIKTSIRGGSDLHSAFRHTGVFPADFLDALETGEISGQVSESMHVLAKDYEDRAKNYYRLLTVAAGVGVFLFVAALIIFMIFQMFFQYLGILESASQI